MKKIIKKGGVFFWVFVFFDFSGFFGYDDVLFTLN